MGYQQIVSTDIAGFITQLESAMTVAGWTDTTLVGALTGKIFVSAADADGRKCYVELYVDGNGNLAIHVAPELNAGGTDLHTFLDHTRSTDYANVTWECAIYDDAVWFSSGASYDNLRACYGLYQPFRGSTISLWPNACFLAGCRDTTSGATQRVYVIGKGDSLSNFYITLSWIPCWWPMGNVTLGANTTTSQYGNILSLAGFADGSIICGRLMIGGIGGSTTYDPAGMIGYHKHLVLMCKSTAYSVGDRVTLDAAVTYYRVIDNLSFWGFYHANTIAFEE